MCIQEEHLISSYAVRTLEIQIEMFRGRAMSIIELLSRDGN